MNFFCTRSELSESLNNVTRAVAAKTTHPAMEGVLINAEDDRLTLSCYNMELGIKTYMPARVSENGSIVLNAKLFSDIIRRLDSENIEIECDEKCMTKIKGGAAEYSIIGIEEEEFPQLPSVDERINFTVSSTVLKSMIDQTIFAVAVNDFKPVHTGSKFIIKDHILSVVSVDGFRLAIRQEPVSYHDELDFVVPGKSLSEVSKLISEEEEILVALSQKHIIFRIGKYDVISRLLEGEFIKYNDIIPKEHDVVECEVKGEPVEMGFNNRYLSEALRATGCDKVKIMITSSLAPVKIVPMEGESFLFLVLPVRMRADI